MTTDHFDTLQIKFLVYFSISGTCKCTSEYGLKALVEAYCAMWDSDGPWCYVTGGSEGKSCAGAIKSQSGHGDIYWTKDAGICSGEENNIRSSE